MSAKYYFFDYYCLLILVKVRLRGTVFDTNGQRKHNQFRANILQNVTEQSTVHLKTTPLKLSAVYMIYKITNKDTNPRRMWKRLVFNKTALG